MPIAAPKPCSFGGCGVLVRGGSRCAEHPLEAWAKSTARPTKRISGRRLQRMRTSLFDRQPLCEECQRQGRTTAATQRDHKVPLAEGGADDMTNEQALCEPCHDAKSEAEAARGRRRAGSVGTGAPSLAAPIQGAEGRLGGRNDPRGASVFGADQPETVRSVSFLRAQVSRVGGVSPARWDDLDAEIAK